MTLPLIVGGKILGALDVQSTKEMAFSDEDISTITVLANQIAIAIENAELFASTQAALESTRRAYSEAGRAGWQRLLGESKTAIGYISAAGAVSPISGEANPESIKSIKSGKPILANDNTTLHLPIKVREDVIGAVRLDKPQGGGRWTEDDIAVAITLSEQLGTALESARLYEQISTRAELELLIGEITANISSSIQYETIMRTTVEELGRTLGNVDVVLQLQSTDTGKARK